MFTSWKRCYVIKLTNQRHFLKHDQHFDFTFQNLPSNLKVEMNRNQQNSNINYLKKNINIHYFKNLHVFILINWVWFINAIMSNEITNGHANFFDWSIRGQYKFERHWLVSSKLSNCGNLNAVVPSVLFGGLCYYCF